jgi:hypothetical protein
MAALGSAQGVPELIGPADVDLRPVAGDHAVPLEAKVQPVLGIETLCSLVEHPADEVRFDLHPGLAEGGSRDGSLRGQGQIERSAFVPEGVEERLIATPAGVSDKVEEEGDEDLRREWAAPREVLLPAAERAGIRAGKEPGD